MVSTPKRDYFINSLLLNSLKYSMEDSVVSLAVDNDDDQIIFN